MSPSLQAIALCPTEQSFLYACGFMKCLQLPVIDGRSGRPRLYKKVYVRKCPERGKVKELALIAISRELGKVPGALPRFAAEHGVDYGSLRSTMYRERIQRRLAKREDAA